MKIPPQVKLVTDFIFKKCSNDIGSVLIWTTIGGWVASSAAQIGGIARNPKYSKEQKTFMINQEIGDAAINIGSFFIITTPLKKLATKLVKTGKVTTCALKEPLKRHGDIDKLGHVDFDMTKLPYFSEMEKKFNSFNNFMSTSAAVIGGVLSSNIVTPILRNRYASHRQAKKQALFNQDKLLNVQTNPVKTPASNNVAPVSNPVRTRVSNSPFDKFRGRNLTV